MAAKAKPPANKGANKRSSRQVKASSSSKFKKPGSSKSGVSKPTQHRPKPTIATTKKKPPHLRYTEKELGVPSLNGIRPAGVQKAPNKKKGKQFVDDGEGMRTILAMVMAEKEGNMESKLMRARQMEEIREARRAETEKRAESKKAGLEEKKDEIRQKKNQKRWNRNDRAPATQDEDTAPVKKKSRKRVSFG